MDGRSQKGAAPVLPRKPGQPKVQVARAIGRTAPSWIISALLHLAVVFVATLFYFQSAMVDDETAYITQIRRPDAPKIASLEPEQKKKKKGPTEEEETPGPRPGAGSLAYRHQVPSALHLGRHFHPAGGEAEPVELRPEEGADRLHPGDVEGAARDVHHAAQEFDLLLTMRRDPLAQAAFGGSQGLAGERGDDGAGEQQRRAGAQESADHAGNLLH